MPIVVRGLEMEDFMKDSLIQKVIRDVQDGLVKNPSEIEI
jgi:hypothetical protein